MQNSFNDYPIPDFLRNQAYRFAEWGLSMLPVNDNKEPAVPKWKPYQTHIPSVYEINAMFERTTWGIAIICGAVSSNTELLDIDCKYDLTGKMYEEFVAIVESLAPGLMEKPLIEKTINGGYHLIYRCAQIEGSLKLASRPATEEEIKKKPDERQKVLFETKGEGGYFVSAPTHGYEIIQGAFENIPEITPAEREILFQAASSFDQVPKLYTAPKQKINFPSGGSSPFEDYNQRGDCIALLEKHGWTVAYERGHKIFLKRPGDTKAKQSGNFDKEKNWFSVFSTSTGFEIRKAYQPCAVFAILECGGDFGEAAKQLLEMGYGEKKSFASNHSSGKSFQDVSHLPVLNFPDEVYASLPEFLKRACAVFTTQIERDVFLVGALGVLSGCFPNYCGIYDNHKTASNLFVMVYGAASAGKGSLKWARYLGSEIHDHLKQYFENDFAKYEQDLDAYNADKKRNKGVTSMQKPVEPKRKLLFIPANTSTSAIIAALNANNGRGIIFASEADALSGTLGQEWGNFSDVLRGGFHSEYVGMLRRTNQEFAEVNNPEPVVVLSGTPHQVVILIPDPENGLFSRFLYFEVEMIPEMKDVFANDECFDDFFLSLGKEIFNLWYKLNNDSNGIRFDFTTEQKKTFMGNYTRSHAEFFKSLGDHSIASVRRLGLINFRIAMILSMLRTWESKCLPDRITCSDMDFENAFRITEVLKEHARKLYLSFPANYTNPYGLKGNILKFFNALPAGVEFTYETAMKVADSLKIVRDTAEGYLYNKLVPKKLVLHPSQNNFFKPL